MINLDKVLDQLVLTAIVFTLLIVPTLIERL